MSTTLPQAVTVCTSSMPRYSLEEAATSNLASDFCRKLYDSIREFDSALNPEQETAIRLVAFGQTITFTVTSLGYTDPSLIHFYGILESGQPVELIQHVSQINFLLTIVLRQQPEQPKPPIGFRHKS